MLHHILLRQLVEVVAALAAVPRRTYGRPRRNGGSGLYSNTLHYLKAVADMELS